MSRLYSKDLVQAWKRALIDTYGFEEYMDFIVQPSFGKKYLSYLPQINYTDREASDVKDLLELAKESHYQIRVLNFSYDDFKDFDTVTMRLDVRGKSVEEIKKGYKRLAKRAIAKHEKLPITMKKNSDIHLFFDIVASIYKDHGTPVFPKSLLFHLKNHIGESINFYIFFNHNEPIGGYMSFVDNKILTLQIGGLLNRYKEQHSSYYLQHLVVVDNVENNEIEVVDFGRSPYNGGTYFFKTRFGAKPVKIDILSSDTKNIYEAYTFAANIWKKIPRPITDTIGPKLTKYLVDL